MYFLVSGNYKKLLCVHLNNQYLLYKFEALRQGHRLLLLLLLILLLLLLLLLILLLF